MLLLVLALRPGLDSGLIPPSRPVFLVTGRRTGIVALRPIILRFVGSADGGDDEAGTTMAAGVKNLGDDSTPSGAGPAAGGPRGLVAGRLVAFLALVLSALVLRTAVTFITPLLDRIGDDVGFGSAVAGVFGMVPTAM